MSEIIHKIESIVPKIKEDQNTKKEILVDLEGAVVIERVQKYIITRQADDVQILFHSGGTKFQHPREIQYKLVYQEFVRQLQTGALHVGLGTRRHFDIYQESQGDRSFERPGI